MNKTQLDEYIAGRIAATKPKVAVPQFNIGTVVEHGGHLYRVNGIGGNSDRTYMHCQFEYVGPS